MLHAVLNSKAARVSVDGKDVSWRELFRKREDLLTAVFFGRFSYLSGDMQLAVLGLLLGGAVSPADFGEFEDIEFWPHFERVGRRGYVEPDVLVYFSHMLLVVEVKPPHDGAQSPQQWSDELESVLAEKESRLSSRRLPDKIVFLALGRNSKNWRIDAAELQRDFSNDGLNIAACEWAALTQGIGKLLDGASDGNRAVLSDWIQAFWLYGLSRGYDSFNALLPLINHDFGGWQSFLSRPFGTSLELLPATSAWPVWADLFEFSNSHLLELES